MDQNKKDAAEAMSEARMKLIKIASVCIAGAIVLACYAFTRVEDAITQTVLYGISSLIATFAGIFIIGAVSIGRAEKNRRNFFLYDRKKKADIAVSELTVATVRERLLEFMAIFKRHGKLYIGELFDGNPHIPERFKPLFCYEILYELASDDGSVDTKTFLGFGMECADVFTKYLRENGDYELAASIRVYICDYSGQNDNSESFKEYLKTKKAHIEAQMLGYAVKNIERFK